MGDRWDGQIAQGAGCRQEEVSGQTLVGKLADARCYPPHPRCRFFAHLAGSQQGCQCPTRPGHCRHGSRPEGLQGRRAASQQHVRRARAIWFAHFQVVSLLKRTCYHYRREGSPHCCARPQRGFAWSLERPYVEAGRALTTLNKRLECTVSASKPFIAAGVPLKKWSAARSTASTSAPLRA